MQIDISTQDEYAEDEWWDLWRRDPHATPFQSPAWLLPWRRYFKDGETLILSLRSGGRPMGLLPFFRLQGQGRLMLWGAGTSDWLGGLLDPTLDEDALRCALACLGGPIDLFQLPPECLLTRFAVPQNWDDRRSLSESCAVLLLPAQPTARMRQKFRYYCRRSVRAGVGEPLQVGATYIKDLADLHSRRWADRDQPGVFADPRFLAWQKEAAVRLEAAGMLCLYALHLEGRLIGALYVLSAKRRAFYYIGGFDPDYSHLGLGTVLVGHAISEAERQGMTTFDFLRGREAYKYRWGATDQNSYARYMAPISAGTAP